MNTPQKNTPAQKVFLIVFGVALGFVLVEMFLRIVGGIFIFQQESRNRASLKARGEFRILCLGESTTALGGRHAYPQQLEETLNQQNSRIKFSVINAGRPGVTTGALMADIESHVGKYQPHIVLAMMGINDSIYGEGPVVAERKGIWLTAVNRLKTLRVYKLLSLLKPIFFNQKLQDEKDADKTDDVDFKGSAEIFGPQGKPFRVFVQGKTEDMVLIRRALDHADLGDWQKAIAFLESANQKNPTNEWSYLELGLVYYRMGNVDQAETAYKKAIEINPLNDEAFYRLGYLYPDRRVVNLLLKAIELDPHRIDAYMELVEFFRLNGRQDQVEEMYRRAISANPHIGWGYGGLARFYRLHGKPDLAREYSKKAKEVRLKYYNSVTRHNYLALKTFLDKKNILLIAVQYPMRNVEPLKEMLSAYGDVLFVDNRSSFREAVRNAGYDAYFRDRFGGDFGHCTARGNKLLAENVAKVILAHLDKSH